MLPAIFLDRDGVLIKEKHHLHQVEDVEIIPGVPEALALAHEAGYLTVVITNQPVVARGLCTEADVQQIHRRMCQQLAIQGGHLSAIYYCPHHPGGADIEMPNPEYICECSCRKPNVGMVDRAVQELGIDPSKSVFVGDTTTDALTAIRAGIKFIGVETGYGCKDGEHALNWDNINTYSDLRAVMSEVLGIKEL